MGSAPSRGAKRRRIARTGALWAGIAAGVLALAGCQTASQTAGTTGSISAPRTPTVAFESIDGMPRPAFDALVQRLNDEARTRPLAIASREDSSVYRVKGYIAAVRQRDQASIVWTWDVYDAAENRTVRLTGEEKATGRYSDAWAAADDSMMRRVASNSLDQLTAFLRSREGAGTASTGTAAPRG
jgi:hypothetical protein